MENDQSMVGAPAPASEGAGGPAPGVEDLRHLELGPFARRVAGLLEIEIEADVNPYDHLVDDWGIDSLQVFQVLVIVEAMAGAMVPPPEVPDLQTVGDAYDYYRALLVTIDA